jgi:hypothetical protein
VVALLLLATAVAVPRGRDALAAAPLLGPVTKSLLRLTGMDAAGQLVTPLRGGATSSGVTISLTGGYADNQRTVVILHLSPAAIPELPITLQSEGARVPLTEPVVSPNLEGDVVLVFGPIANPARAGNALTLHVAGLGPIPTLGRPAPGLVDRIGGDWTLRFTLTVDRSAAVAAPAPGHLGDLSVSFTASVVGTDVQLSAHLHGATIGQVLDMTDVTGPAKGSTATPGPRRWGFELLDEAGRPVTPLRLAMSDGSTPRDFTDVGVWSVPGPGTYLIVATWQGSSLARTIVVR